MRRAPLSIALMMALGALLPGTTLRAPRLAAVVPRPIVVPRPMMVPHPAMAPRPVAPRPRTEAPPEKGAAPAPAVTPPVHDSPHATPLPSPWIWHRMA